MPRRIASVALICAVLVAAWPQYSLWHKSEQARLALSRIPVTGHASSHCAEITLQSDVLIFPSSLEALWLLSFSR
jgi:hypothetical protein